MGEFTKNLKSALDNEDLTSKEVLKLKQIVNITKENIVETEFHEKFISMVSNYDLILKKQAVKPDVAAKANIVGDKFDENITEADKLLEFILPIIQNELEINLLIKETRDSIDYLLYNLEYDKSVMISQTLDQEDEKFKITDENNFNEFKLALLKIKDRFDKTYLIE